MNTPLLYLCSSISFCLSASLVPPHPLLDLFLFLLFFFFFRTSGKFGSNTEFTALKAFSAEKCLRPSPLQSKITQQPI